MEYKYKLERLSLSVEVLIGMIVEKLLGAWEVIMVQYWLLNHLFCVYFFVNIAYLGLATDSDILFLNYGVLFACGCRNIIILSILFSSYKISNVDGWNHRVISFDRYMFFLSCNNPVWKFISLLEFLMMASTLECCFGLKKRFHFLEKGIRPK